MKRVCRSLAAGVLLCGVPAGAQVPGRPAAPANVDAKKIDEAVEKGAKFLLAQATKGFKDLGEKPKDPEWGGQTGAELTLYTLIFSGIDLNDPVYIDLFNKIMSKPLDRTYAAALRAMTLEALDREKFREGIAECAQYLVDGQCRNGQWNYGEPMEKSAHTWTPDPAKPVTFSAGGASTAAGGGGGGSATGHDRPASESPASKGQTKAQKRIAIPRRKIGPPSGDNSNTQYALLGLRACLDAGIAIQADVLPMAEAWWVKDQKFDAKNPKIDGGWGYSQPSHADRRREPYGPMVAGGVSSLAICCAYQNKPWQKSPNVLKGIEWLGANFSVQDVPELTGKYHWLYYYLYSLERAGVLAGFEKYGAHDWYKEGAEFILSKQRKDGSWTDGDEPVLETCFAILFLRRATKILPTTFTH